MPLPMQTLDTLYASHDVRAGCDSSFQPVRLDKNMASQGLSASRGWENGIGPQS